MATSRREPDARNNRTIQAMSTGVKPTDPAKGLRRARSVPSSPDRKLSPSHAASSSNTCRPSSSFSTHTASSRSTFGSASSSIHSIKALQTSSSTTTAKPANAMKGKADKSSGSSVWPPALTARSHSSKDMNRTAKSSSAMQKSNLSSRPGVDKMAASSAKQRTQKATPGALAGGKAQAVPSVRAPGTTTKKTVGVANSVPSIQRTTSVPSRPIEAPKVDEQEVELLMEFDEMESISTPSIEEHLQERLPDPVELKQVDVIAYLLSGDNPSESASNQQEDKNEEVVELISEEKHQVPDNNNLNGRDNADIGIKSKVQAVKEAIDESELKEAANETELNEAVDETKLNEVVSESGLYKDVNATKYTENAIEPVLIEKEEAEENVEMVVPPKKTLKPVQEWRKDDGKRNEMKEEARSKPTEERKSKVMALIGRFETAMSG
uniref:Calmodulin-binding domain-containing protein n=1 Tax=Oryza punctata TaxID=4537 RepID=A0A0E0JZK6_ORYPU